MKRILFYLILISLMLSPLNLSVNLPVYATEQGQYGDFKYSEHDGSISILKYTGPGGDVIIPDEINGKPVTQLNNIFEDCKNVTAVFIPGSIVQIDLGTFINCIDLIEINVESSNSQFSSIDGVLFNQDKTTLMMCPNGKSGAYSIPEGVKQIGDQGFYLCGKLSSIQIPSSVSTIGSQAFSYCSKINSITIPENLTKIGGNAFEFCAGLTDIQVDRNNSMFSSIDGVLFNKFQTTLIAYPSGKSGAYSIPEDVTAVMGAAIYYCANLTAITIPKSMIMIAEDFIGCYNLTAIEVDSNNSVYGSINGVLYNKDKTVIIKYPPGKKGPYSIRETVTRIDDRTFVDCKYLASLAIPNGITEIKRYAFAGCRNLTTIIIPSSVSFIDDTSFKGSNESQLTFFINPSNDYAFAYARQHKYKAISTKPIDMEKCLWAADSAQIVIQHGIMLGNSDEHDNLVFRPADPASRAEFAAVLFNYIELMPDGKAVFDDTSSHWAADYIAKLAELGIMQGISPTQFAPDEFITREQIATILNRALKPAASPSDFRYTDNADISDWARDSVYAAHAAGWISGDDAGAFRPSDTATRAEVAVIFARLIQAKETL